MKAPKRYLVTSALPYANGPLHIGQIAGAYLPADIYVRYLRGMGRDVAFICGSDEHGAAITLRARKDGVSPKEIVDKYHEMNKKAFEGLGISFDIYHRTSEELHHETARDVFRKLESKGVFSTRESEQFYDEEYGQFLADRYIMGTCPKCGNDRAYGDQCERCGRTLSPNELIDPRSTLSGSVPIRRKTKHWYLPLDKDEGWLREWLVDGKGRSEEWKKNVLGQVKSWLDDGLQPRAITRDLDWGVKVPLEGAEGKVLYVWLDAPVGYISATRQWALDKGLDWEPYWKSADTKLLHFIGKDNIVFHCLIFPAILHHLEDYILPTNVPANEFMNMESEKISTSRNWAVWIPEYIEQFPDKIDVLRYVLCANSPETGDSEFTWKDYQSRNNSELVATFGNFINRVLVLTGKYFGGSVPEADLLLTMEGLQEGSSAVDYEHIVGELAALQQQVAEKLEEYKFRDGQKAMMEVARRGNWFLQANEPWKKIKDDPARVATVMFTALQIVDVLSVLAEPFLPQTSARIRRMLNRPEVQPRGWKGLAERLVPGLALLAPGHELGQVELLFDKVEDDFVQARLDHLAEVKRQNAATAGEAEAPSHEPLKEEIQYDDFGRLDMRTGTILAAEKMPKADKLLKLQVDLGFEQRTIVSGIAQQFDPSELEGRRVVVLANLAPRKLRGVESQGMILMSEDAAGRLAFLEADEETPNGSVVS